MHFVGAEYQSCTGLWFGSLSKLDNDFGYLLLPFLRGEKYF